MSRVFLAYLFLVYVFNFSSWVKIPLPIWMPAHCNFVLINPLRKKARNLESVKIHSMVNTDLDYELNTLYTFHVTLFNLSQNSISNQSYCLCFTLGVTETQNSYDLRITLLVSSRDEIFTWVVRLQITHILSIAVYFQVLGLVPRDAVD